MYTYLLHLFFCFHYRSKHDSALTERIEIRENALYARACLGAEACHVIVEKHGLTCVACKEGDEQEVDDKKGEEEDEEDEGEEEED